MHHTLIKLKHIGILLLFLMMLLPSFSLAEQPISITTSTSTSHDGAFSLAWVLPTNTTIELQQSQSDTMSFSTIYRGNDSATMITGLSNGQFYFRARTIDDQMLSSRWSKTISVTVEHHSLTRAFSIFAIGGFVFLSTLLLIVFGYKTSGALLDKQTSPD